MESSYQEIVTIQLSKDIAGPIFDYYNKYRIRCYHTKLNSREKAKFKIALDPVIEPIPLKIEDYTINSYGDILTIQIPKDILLTMFDYHNKYKWKCYRDKLNSREKAKYKSALEPVLEPIPLKLEDFPFNLYYVPSSSHSNIFLNQPSTTPSSQYIPQSRGVSIPLSLISSSLTSTQPNNVTPNPIPPTNPVNLNNQISFKLS